MVIFLERGAHLHTAAHSECDGQLCVCVCVCVCARACVRARVRACVRACVRVFGLCVLSGVEQCAADSECDGQLCVCVWSVCVVRC